MVDFSISRIMLINALYSLPIFLMYKLSSNIYYVILITLFMITHSFDMYFQTFFTKSIHLIVFLCTLLFMIIYLYEKSNVIDYIEYFIISITLAISIYFLISILKKDNNYTLNRGYLIFSGVSFLYFSSLPGLSDTI